MQTTYSVDILPAEHPVFKPDMIPNDFSAFNNFNIARHSYWEKTAEEIQVYLTTGQFPERVQANNQQVPQAVTASIPVAPTPVTAAPTYVAPAANTVPGVTTTPYVAPAPVTEAVAPTAAPVVADPNANTAAPARNFSGFSF
jgi:hypothetical protein